MLRGEGEVGLGDSASRRRRWRLWQNPRLLLKFSVLLLFLHWPAKGKVKVQTTQGIKVWHFAAAEGKNGKRLWLSPGPRPESQSEVTPCNRSLSVSGRARRLCCCSSLSRGTDNSATPPLAAQWLFSNWLIFTEQAHLVSTTDDGAEWVWLCAVTQTVSIADHLLSVEEKGIVLMGLDD